MKDILGQDITVGSKIVYPQRQSSSIWMEYAEVTEVREKNLRVQRLNVVNGVPLGRPSTLTALGRVVVVKP